VSSLTKVLDYTSKIAVTCVSALLIACEPLIFGGISGLGGSTSFTVTQCANGFPADLSGVCRNNSPTMGALEAVDTQITMAAYNTNFTSVSTGNLSSPLTVTWSPYVGSVFGYLIYYGPTSDTANTLASDIIIGASSFDPSAPMVSYQPNTELGLNSGNTVCFRIIAYDIGRVPYAWSEMQCTVV